MICLHFVAQSCGLFLCIKERGTFKEIRCRALRKSGIESGPFLGAHPHMQGACTSFCKMELLENNSGLACGCLLAIQILFCILSSLITYPAEPNLPSGEWHCLASELLDILKAKLEESKDDVILQTMKRLRLVNRHWSLWATGAMKMLKITRHSDLSTEVVETLAKTFVNLSTLHLCRMENIPDNGLRTLLKLPNLTYLDVNGKDHTIANSFTNVDMGYLGRLTALRDLDLCESMGITDAGVKELASLTSLTRLRLRYYRELTMDGAKWLGSLTGSRGLNFMCLCIDDGMRYATLTSLTGLSLSPVNGSITDDLGSLVHLRDLRLDNCRTVANLGLKHLTSFANLTSLQLKECFAITDDGIRHLNTLTSLTMLYLSYAQTTDRAMVYLAGLASLKDLRLHYCGRILMLG